MGFFSKPKESMQALKDLKDEAGLMRRVAKVFSDRKKREQEESERERQEAESEVRSWWGGSKSDEKKDS